MIKKGNQRITITISNEDYDKIIKTARSMEIHPTRYITKLIHAYCIMNLEETSK